MTNPLLEFDALPDFGAIRPEHVTPAIDRLLREAEAALERAVGPDVAADYDAMSAVLDVATERLGRAWGMVSHLNSVADTPELRAAFNENLPKVTAFHYDEEPSLFAITAERAGGVVASEKQAVVVGFVEPKSA